MKPRNLSYRFDASCSSSRPANAGIRASAMRAVILACLQITLGGPILYAQSGSESAIPIYVTPFYYSEGPQINVGEFSDDLAAADAQSILEIEKEISQKWETLPFETMYVVAI